MDSKCDAGACGCADGVEGAGYCQGRCRGVCLSCGAFIGSGGEERKDEEESGGESDETHLVSLIWEVRGGGIFFFYCCRPILCWTKICGVGPFDDSRW